LEIPVYQDILEENDIIARNNNDLFRKHSVLAVNLMASPGAGKTTLLERTIEFLGPSMRLGVIEGDLATNLDQERIRKRGVPVAQINTGSGCHLSADMIREALEEIPLPGMDILFIENVGNLVCPAEFRLGEALRIVLASVPEGDEKPVKYPLMFREADSVVLNKTDLLPHVPFDLEAFVRNLYSIRAEIPFFPLSCLTKEGLSAWLEWLKRQRDLARRA
jgi:hydrogenase nickel incorporation protein HypB